MKLSILFTPLLVLVFATSIFAQTEIPSQQSPAAEHALSGFATSIDGNWAIISSPQKDNGDLQSIGEVTFYAYSDDGWNAHQIEQPEGLPELSNFGISTVLSGDNAFVSSIGDHQNGLFSGAVYAYEFLGDSWMNTQILKGSDTGMGHRFGNALDSRGGMLVAGAYMAPGAEEKSGAAYIFELQESGWVETAKLSATDGENGDYFGHSVHIINQNLVAVGAYRASGAEESSGAVYLFERDGDEWNQIEKLRDPSGTEYDVFGYSLTSVSMESFVGETETVLLVGAPGSAQQETLKGSVYLYTQEEGSWGLINEITHDEASLNSYFGISLASNSIGEVFIGASRTHSGSQRESGSIFKYQLMSSEGNIMLESDDIWVSPDPQTFDNFGAVVSASDEFVVISSPYANRDDLENSGRIHFYSNLAVSNEEVTETIDSFDLYQNYPNPFNPSTVISYQLPVNSEVSLRVFDMLGREVVTLVDRETKAAGAYNVTFDAGNLASGMYVYRLQAGEMVITKKLTLIK